MDTYEVAVLYHPDLEMDLEKATSKLKKIIEANGGKIVNEDVWGKRKLAYPIAGNEHAVYAFYDVEIEGARLTKLEATIGITEEVIRFLVTKPDVDAIAKAKLARAQRKRTDDRKESKDSDKSEKSEKPDKSDK